MFLEEGSDNESIATDSTVEEDVDSDHEFAIEQILAEWNEEDGKYLSKNRSDPLLSVLTDRSILSKSNGRDMYSITLAGNPRPISRTMLSMSGTSVNESRSDQVASLCSTRASLRKLLKSITTKRRESSVCARPEEEPVARSFPTLVMMSRTTRTTCPLLQHRSVLKLLSLVLANARVRLTRFLSHLASGWRPKADPVRIRSSVLCSQRPHSLALRWTDEADPVKVRKSILCLETL